jgi:hypothetical protein
MTGPTSVRRSVVPLEDNAERVEVFLLRETIGLSCEADLITEMVGHRDFGAEG